MFNIQSDDLSHGSRQPINKSYGTLTTRDTTWVTSLVPEYRSPTLLKRQQFRRDSIKEKKEVFCKRPLITTIYL